ncbi:RraA family protein [Paraburkholderia sp. BR13439]|uniref:Putative 4-hydroxy-4-methyl-2-oxoglutarate aldolase n=1 Tax=Paraburkholderia youngii TaxID=2782701 RepID=A0A7W8L1P0_9BURK|nr:RraA family protein [Paraburkholderia youngii]MBB5398575.1 regulator of RNase E activity RraA [Paraburkholderia youngii]NUX58251.1 RraA family protein [Paraburkholderia youngii]NVH77233.1 RraA family protein [Paraburkholderia youngii]NVI07770.1 RraA family protein [Paraburkholderia youngii]
MKSKDEYVHRLRRLDCCAVSDALDKLGLTGVVSGVQQASGTRRIAGRVITMKLGVGDPPPGPPRHLGTTAIELGGADDVIVVEQRTGVEAGSWGGILSLGAKVRGIAGVIADGPVRDIDESREMDLPVFANAFTARTARGRIVEKGVNVPVEVFGTAVEAGDYVIADSSAVIFISAANVARVIETAESIVAREALMAKAVLAGTPIHEVMGGNYEFMLKD